MYFAKHTRLFHYISEFIDSIDLFQVNDIFCKHNPHRNMCKTVDLNKKPVLANLYAFLTSEKQ